MPILSISFNRNTARVAARIAFFLLLVCSLFSISITCGKKEEQSSGACGRTFPTTPVGGAFSLTFDDNQFPSSLFGFNEDQNYWDTRLVAGRVTGANGALQISNTASDWNGTKLTSGGMRSEAYYGYGVLTFRLKASAMPGIVTAVYFYTEDKDLSEGGVHEEIDVELAGALHPGKASLVSYHCAPQGLDNDIGDDRFAGGIIDIRAISGLSSFSSTDFHEWKIDYAEGQIVWYVDGIEVYRTTRAVPSGTKMHLLFDAYHSTKWDAFIATPPSGSGTAELDSMSFTPR